MILRTLAASAAAVALFSSVAPAATSWSTASGSSDTINYSDGKTDNQLFTDRRRSSALTRSSSSPPVSPPATSGGTPVSNSTLDVLSFIVTAKPGKSLDRISAGMRGDWSQSVGSSVDAVGTLTITNLATSEVLQQNLVFTPTMPSALEEGIFEGLASIDLPDTWLGAMVQLSGKMTASTVVGGTSFIQLKGTDVNVQTTAVPLPSAVAAAPLGIAIAWFARRRMTR